MSPPPFYYETLWPWMQLAGRVLFAGSLMINSLGHFTNTAGIAGYAASKKVPSPTAATLLSGIVLWAGCLFILLGWHRFIGAGLVILFLVPVSFWIHPYWSETDPTTRTIDRIQFWKNMAMTGAAFFIACYSGPSWPFSIGG